jgi:hypothetical protein
VVLSSVAYWTPGAGFEYVAFDGSTWTVEPAAAAPAPTSIASATSPDEVTLTKTGVTALTLDSSGEPWMAQALLDQNNAGQGTLVIRHRALGVWTGETLGTTTGIPSIEFDYRTGFVHVLYQTPQGPTYAWRTSSGWNFEPFDPPSAVVATMRIDGAGRVRVAYVAYPSLSLYCATRTPGGWVSQLIDSTSRCFAPSLAFKGLGRAHIAYGDQDPVDRTTRLKYAEDRPDIGWTTEPISPAGSSIYEFSLAVSPGNVPYVAFQDLGLNCLRATWRSNGVWTTETVDAYPESGQHPSIGVNEGYEPVVAYKGGLSSGTRVATGNAIVVGIDPPPAPAGLRISGSWPNPVRSGGSLRLTVLSPKADRVRLEAFDASGRSVGRSALLPVAAGQTRLEWAARPQPGLLFLRLVSEAGRSAVARVVVVD